MTDLAENTVRQPLYWHKCACAVVQPMTPHYWTVYASFL